MAAQGDALKTAITNGLSRIGKSAVVRTRLGREALLVRYPYAFAPSQLWALCAAATEAAQLGGAFIEVGVGRGDTTVLLNRHLRSLGAANAYLCLDTFAGFTDDDIATERQRGKTDKYERWFRNRTRRIFELGLKENGLDGQVKVIQADAATFDYSLVPDLAFAFVDVDLHRPMRAALEGCWNRLLPGGIMVADDCQAGDHMWDGSRVAYEDFCAAHGLDPDVREVKLGFAQKPIGGDPE